MPATGHRYRDAHAPVGERARYDEALLTLDVSGFPGDPAEHGRDGERGHVARGPGQPGGAGQPGWHAGPAQVGQHAGEIRLTLAASGDGMITVRGSTMPPHRPRQPIDETRHVGEQGSIVLRAIIGLSAALALLAACGGKRSEPSPDSTFLVSWARHLGGAQRVFQAGHFVVGEWEPTTQARPAPPTVASFSVDGQPGPSGPGWVLSSGRSANEVVVVRESDTALHYCVYRLSEPGGACHEIPAPDDAPWVFRAAECGNDTTKCLLVRWSRRAGVTAIRLALTVVDADALSAATTHVIEVEGSFYGTADTGGVAVNPTQPTAYLLESASKDDPKYYVRAVSLTSGETLWRAELRQDLDKGGHVRLICAGSGQHVLVASGSTRYGLFSVHSMDVIDAATGATRPIDARQDDWRDVLLVRGVGGDAVLRVKFSAVRSGLGESPDFDIAAVDQITMSGRLSNLWTARVRPGEAPTSRLASAALSIGKSTLLLAPASGLVVRDPASSTTQEERRRLVNGLINH